MNTISQILRSLLNSGLSKQIEDNIVTMNIQSIQLLLILFIIIFVGLIPTYVSAEGIYNSNTIISTASTRNIDITQRLHLDNFITYGYYPTLVTPSGKGGFYISWTAKNNTDADLNNITINGSILLNYGFDIENANFTINSTSFDVNGNIGTHTNWLNSFLNTSGINNIFSFTDGGRATPNMTTGDKIIYNAVVDAIALDTNEDGIYNENDKATLRVVTIPNAPVVNSIWGTSPNGGTIEGYSNQQFAIIYDSDFNCDGIVNLKDFTTLAAGWLDEYDITDLKELAEFWLK